MKRFTLVAIVPLIASIGIALTPAMPVNAISTCGGTSLVQGIPFKGGLTATMRVPTVLDNHPSQFDCQLAEGNAGTAVARLQIDLVDCYQQNIKVDGIFGPMTKMALMNAQRMEGIPSDQVDGIYGPNTIDGFQYEIQNATSIGECLFIVGR